MFLSKNSSDCLHNEELTNPLAEIWHKSCPSLETVSFPNSIWCVRIISCIFALNANFKSRVLNSRLGWVTLKELERILSERERDLEQKEKDLEERERALINRQLSHTRPRSELSS